MTDNRRCKCGKKYKGKRKICLYSVEINNKKRYCSCCPECRQECTDDI